MWEKRVRVFQFFSLTGSRDCVFLAERRERIQRSDGGPLFPPPFFRSRPRADFVFRFVSRSNDSPERKPLRRLTIPLHVPRNIFPSSFLTLSPDPEAHLVAALINPKLKKKTRTSSRIFYFTLFSFSATFT